MKVLYLINHAGKGGTERYVEALATGLDITPYFAYNEDDLLNERMKAAGVPVFRLEMKSRFDLTAAKLLAHFCRENDIDVIHTHFLRENYIALLSRLFYSKTRVVYTNHMLLSNNFITRISNRLLSPLQHHVITVCGAGKARLTANGIPERLITVIHNGIDPAKWACEKHDNEELTFVYAARIVQGKGHESLLNAAALLKDKLFKLIIAGEGELLADMRALAGRLGVDDKVEFAGFCADMKPVLAASDVCISASESEALSMSILEAMAAGLPIIATDVGGNPEILRSGCGVLVPFDNPQALAEVMLDMLENPEKREKYGQASLAAANGDFNISVMLSKTKSIYGG